MLNLQSMSLRARYASGIAPLKAMLLAVLQQLFRALSTLDISYSLNRFDDVLLQRAIACPVIVVELMPYRDWTIIITLEIRSAERIEAHFPWSIFQA